MPINLVYLRKTIFYHLFMPKIKPFCALKPSSCIQNKVVTRPIEEYSLAQARLIASENPFSFLHLINPQLDHPYLRGARPDLIYKKITDNLEDFLSNKVLITQEKPSIYVYQVVEGAIVQTGIWALTHIKDYVDGNIKKHEHTVDRREKLLAEYIQQTALDANPVLLTYHPVKLIDNLIAKYVAKLPDIDLIFTDTTQHRIWIIDNLKEIDNLVNAFDELPKVYIADGHHRIASMAKMAFNKSLYTKDEESRYNYFSSAYFSTAQIKISAYNRLVRDLNEYTELEFLSKIENNFVVEEIDYPLNPFKIHQFGMYLNTGWYKLTAKKHIYNENDPVSVLDVSILHNYILSPLLGINDPKTDARITFEGGKTDLKILQQQVNNRNYAVAFSMFPITVQQLMNIADANEVMPPKSTWIEPKFLVGLLTHCLDN